MYCKHLEIAELDSETNSCPTRTVVNPSWFDVHDAIHRLDKHARPYIYISPQTSESERCSDGGQWLEIQGGNDDYWIAVTIDERFQRPIMNPDGDDTEIELWTSDQGFGAPSKHVIHDLITVLATAQYYFEHGDFYPNVEWDK